MLNCIECINDEKYLYLNDTTNCLEKNEIKKRDIIELSILKNYNFYIFLTIFIIAFIISFSISYVFNWHIGKNVDNLYEPIPDDKKEKEKIEEMKHIN